MYDSHYEDTAKTYIEIAQGAEYSETRTEGEQAALVYSNLAIVELLKEISARLEGMEQTLRQLQGAERL